MKLNREQIIKLSKNLTFELTEDEIDNILEEFETFNHQVMGFQTIDTTEVEPMVYPFENPTTFLREDEEVSELSLEAVLLNAPESVDEYFVVPKVVD